MAAEVVIQSIKHMQKDNVPLEIAPYISPEQWMVIVSAVYEAEDNGTRRACCAQVCVCFFCAFPFIFCCHPIWDNISVLNLLNKKCTELNTTMFYGNKVMMTTENKEIMFNFTRCQPLYMNPMFVSSGMVSAAPMIPRESALTDVKRDSIPVAHATATPVYEL